MGKVTLDACRRGISGCPQSDIKRSEADIVGLHNGIPHRPFMSDSNFCLTSYLACRMSVHIPDNGDIREPIAIAFGSALIIIQLSIVVVVKQFNTGYRLFL